MPVTSNAHQLAGELKRLIEGFGFTATVEGKSLGRDCAGIVADGIAARSIDQEAGADGTWTPNAPKYAAWKERKYGVQGPNRRTGQMLSIESLIGTTTIDTHSVSMEYGTGQSPTRSATGHGFNPETDGSITDIEKAYFCSQSRPFYQLDDTISDAVFKRVEECCEQYLVKAGW